MDLVENLPEPDMDKLIFKKRVVEHKGHQKTTRPECNYTRFDNLNRLEERGNSMMHYTFIRTVDKQPLWKRATM